MGTNVGSSFPGYRTTMLLNGYYVRLEDIGNITYGYLGKVTKIPDLVLYNASALNDLKNHGISNIPGETKDQEWITIGIEWYTNTH